MNALSLFVASLLSLNAGQKAKTCHSNCSTSEAGIELISHFEGYSPFVYKDAAGLDTIGVGHLILRGEKFSEPFLPNDADKLLRKDLRKSEASINRRVAVELQQHQADSVISFTFNLGEGKLAKSTLLKKINGKRHIEAAAEFEKWVYADGKKLRGLEIRREAESVMYKGS